MLRSPAAVMAVVLASAGLAACTTQTQKCSDGVCDIDLSGAGANVKLGGDSGSTLELVKASGKTADFEIDGKPGSLSVGQPVPIDNGSIELVAVEGEDDVQIKLTVGKSGTPGSTPS